MKKTKSVVWTSVGASALLALALALAGCGGDESPDTALGLGEGESCTTGSQCKAGLLCIGAVCRDPDGAPNNGAFNNDDVVNNDDTANNDDDTVNNNTTNNETCTSPCDDGNPCTEDDTCVEGTCIGTNTCDCETDADCMDDGDLCNGALVCRGGACEVDAATVVTCPPPADTSCATNTCNPATGACELELMADGLGCNDGDACTASDACRSGVCQGGREVCCDDRVDNDGNGGADCADADCEGDAACSGCVPLPDLGPVPDAPLPGEEPAGRGESVTTVDGFHDDYLYNGAGTFKVGVRREWGGTIVFFGQAGNGPGINNTNTIDANDTGREVQVAFYDPDRAAQNCAHDASCRQRASTCPGSITYLGWNPVQGGNRCNRGSGVESVTNEGGVLTITTLPLHWNPNWDRADCSDSACSDPDLRDRRADVRVIQRLRFVQNHVLEMDYTVINLVDLAHAETAQEMPTVYTANGNSRNGVGSPDLWRLFNSTGNEIAIDQPANDGFFVKNFDSPGGWVTLQNDDLSYGVGMYTENRLTRFQGWQNRGLPFNNFRAVFPFGIPANGFVRARAYLILGARDTVAAEAAWLSTNLPPFGVVDEPAEGARVAPGQLQVGGWVLDDEGVVSVSASVDGGAAVPMSYGGSRPDVCAAWPQYGACGPVGYSGMVDLSGLEPGCPHVIAVTARDTDGNERVVAVRRVEVE